jgi:hypothetical protein
MPTYRIFTVGRDAHFSGMPIIVECLDDKEAVDKAIHLANGLDLEIWDQKRMIARLPGNLPKA